jgi:peptide/nickel transport system substrate-binding protein
MTARRIVAVLGIAVLAMSACGDDGGGGGSASSSATGASSSGSASAAATTTVAPKAGGSLTFAVYGESAGLDPTINSATGVVGGIELTAIYDTLMRYNPTSGQYEPRMAQSLTPNADFTQWTLKLRPDVKFSDGSALDSAAVVASMKRHVDKKSRSLSLVQPIKEYQTPDALTVVFVLDSAWSGFPFALASGPGMITNPAAVAKLGDGLPTNPVGAGAGPFVIDSFKPKESITLKKNPTYWGGQVYLDQLVFVPRAGAQATYDSLKTGTVQAGFLRDAAVISQARSDGFEGYENILSAGETMVINNGVKVACKGGQPAPICTGQADGFMAATITPTSDKRVRQAVAAAIDLTTLNQRLYDGKSKLYNSALVHPNSRWYSGVEGPKFDLATAKQLVTQVKAEGKWDGSIRVSCHSGSPNWGIAVKTMLEAAGFKVALTDSQDVQANTAAVIVKKDYDLACFGTGIADEEPLFAINRDLNSSFTGNAGNWVGYVNPAVDAALAQARAAKTDADKKAALTIIEKAYTADVPFLTLGAVSEFIAWGKQVHGVTATLGTNVYFDKAFLS